MKSDELLQREVVAELRWDTHVSAPDIEVAVLRAAVVLTGIVTSYAQRIAARDAAWRVLGVREVVNELVVQIPVAQRPTDEELVQAARRALDWDVRVPAAAVDGTVADGWVTLRGTVARWTQRQDAERTVRCLRGVRGITNSIRVEEGADLPDTVAAAIEAAVKRCTDQTTIRVAVATRDGTVTLTGAAHSRSEARAVVAAAEHGPGVQHVVDRMHIDPQAWLERRGSLQRPTSPDRPARVADLAAVEPARKTQMDTDAAYRRR